MATEIQTPIDDLNPIVQNPSDVPITDEPPIADDNSKTSIAAASYVEKKMRRAERFGISVQLSEQEKRNSRAERFGGGSGSPVVSGSSVSGPEVSKGAENLKRKARAERFGIAPSSNPVVASDDDAKKKARLARFAPTTKADSQEDDKRKARALRFAPTTPSNAAKEANGNGNVKPVTQNEAIAGKAGGGD